MKKRVKQKEGVGHNGKGSIGMADILALEETQTHVGYHLVNKGCDVSGWSPHERTFWQTTPHGMLFEEIEWP